MDQKAREAVKRGERGVALARWQELLDDVPFDGDLVLAAEAGRSALVAAGLAELGSFRADLERAAFFGLPDLYRECLQGVIEIGAEFAGSEVAPAAADLGAEVREALAAVSGRDLTEERSHTARAQVLGITREAGQVQLAEHIQAAVDAANGKENN